MRRRKQIKAATMLQIGIAGVFLIVLVLILVWYSDGLNSFQPDEGTFQFIAGTKVDHSTQATYRDKDGIIEITDVSGKSAIQETPILYQDGAKITLTKNMLIMVPMEGTQVKRVNCFTTIKEKSGLCTLTLGHKNAQSRGGFLYDGENTYIMLEETKLKVGTHEIELAPLSYVIVAYNQYAEYHNSADNDYEWYALENSNVTGVTKSGYKIDFGKDSIDIGSGEALLFCAVDSVDVIKMGK